MSELTQAEMDRVIMLLRQMSANRRALILRTAEAFLQWLRDTALSVWRSVKGAVHEIWDSIVDFFS